METRAKSSADFRSEIHDILSGHETRINDIVATNDTRFAQHNTRFDQLVELITKSNNRLDQLANDMQALRLPHNQPVSSHIRPTTDREPHFHFRSASNQDPTSFNTRDRHTGETSHNSLAQHSNLKLNFPTYNGLDDPTGWIFKAEQYIEFKQIEPQQQVQLASFHLEKHALQWYRWYTKNKGPLHWDEFTKAVLNRFGPTDYDDPSEAVS